MSTPLGATVDEQWAPRGVLVSRARALERARAGSASAGDDVPSLRSERMERARSSARASANAGASGHAEESFQQAAEEALLSQEGLEIERDSLRDRAEDAELALVRAEAEIARLSR